MSDLPSQQKEKVLKSLAAHFNPKHSGATNDFLGKIDELIEAATKAERERVRALVEGMKPEITRDGNWGHTYNQGKQDGIEKALNSILTALDSESSGVGDKSLV